MKIHLRVSLTRGFGSRRHGDGWKCSWDSECARSKLPSRVGENLSRDFELNELQTRHQSKEEERSSLLYITLVDPLSL
jgi:hypothetical protein